MMSSLMQDIRYGLRMLFKHPGFTLVAVVTLGLGIGANTAIFGVADALIYRPVLLKDLDRLVMVYGVPQDHPDDLDEISPADLIDWRAQTRTLDHLAGMEWWNANLTGHGEPERLQGFRVSADFFEALGEKAMVGRTFLPEEEEPGRDRVAVLSHGLWERRFGADPRIVGRTISLHGQAYEVIGVMDRACRFPGPAELWTPLALTPEQRNIRGSFFVETVARLKPGVTLEEAQADIRMLAQRVAGQHPATHEKRSARVVLLREQASGNYSADYTRMLMGAVGFVLLIACANVANLQFARVSGRLRELSVRSALGAGRWRLIRQLLTESVLLGLLGAIVGVLFALWGLDLIRRGMPAEVEIFLPGWQRLGLNGYVLAYTVTVALLAGIVAGVSPAFAGSRADLAETLKEGGRGASSGLRRHRLKNLLIVSEIILASVLLTGAGLMVKGFRVVADPAPDLAPETALTMRLSLPESQYPEPHQIRAFQERILQNLQTVPGVRSAALIQNLPYSGRRSSSGFTVEGRPPASPAETPVAQFQSASAAYFTAMRIPLQSGRTFTAQDGPDAPLVAIVSASLARRYFPGEDPLGKRVKAGPLEAEGPWRTVVGVVPDVRHEASDRAPRPTLYLPSAQRPARSFDVVLRTASDPAAVVASAKAAIYRVDANLPIFFIKTLQKLIADHLVGFRYVAVLMLVFGALALVLAAVGIYSVMAYGVSQRTHELGLRMALGARPGDVLRLVLGEGALLIGVGLAVGLTASFWLSQVVSGLLFGITDAGVATMIAFAAVLAAAGLAASYIPARRAMRVDPVVALRHE